MTPAKTIRHLRAYRRYLFSPIENPSAIQLSVMNDPDFLEDQRVIRAQAEKARTFESLQSAMAEGGWNQTDVPEHIEMFEEQGKSELADAIRTGMNDSIARNGTFREMEI